MEVTARYGRETAARIGFANCVVDPLGQPLAITKMKRAFCVAELEARGPHVSCAARGVARGAQ